MFLVFETVLLHFGRELFFVTFGSVAFVVFFFFFKSKHLIAKPMLFSETAWKQEV